MNFGDVITIANAALRNHADTNKPYTDADVQEAIRFVLGEFVRLSQCTRVVGGLTITNNTNAMTVSPLTTGFLPARMIDNVAYFTGYDKIVFVDLPSVARKIAESSGTTSQPLYAAWRTDAAALVWPKADATYTLTVDYYQPLASLVSPSDTVNISDEYIRPAIWWGVPAALRYAGREDIIASPMWQNFLSHAAIVRGSSAVDIGDVEPNEEAYL